MSFIRLRWWHRVLALPIVLAALRGSLRCEAPARELLHEIVECWEDRAEVEVIE